jgi:UDP-3-O-[3-hydroxymyristoyl] glucosamine N-acyltransferase
MINLEKISKLIKGELQGDPKYLIKSVNSLKKATKDHISFAAKDSMNIQSTHAAALIVAKGSKIKYPNLIFVEDPYMSFAELLNYFSPHKRFNHEIDGRAIVSKSADIGEDVSIGAFSYVGEHSQIGVHTEIHAGVKIYHNVKIGKNCIIYSNVVIREDVEIGDHVIIQPGVIIGADGFGYARRPDGIPVKIPQKGKVLIGNHCEIGANACIDRSTIEETELKDHVKLDNLVQVGHNVKIGSKTAISGLTGISGSTEIGENVIIGGQVGIGDHIKIADGVMVAGKTGITGNIKEKSIVSGYPHQEIRKWRKNQVIFRNLEKYVDRIKYLEKKIKELEEK